MVAAQYEFSELNILFPHISIPIKTTRMMKYTARLLHHIAIVSFLVLLYDQDGIPALAFG